MSINKLKDKYKIPQANHDTSNLEEHEPPLIKDSDVYPLSNWQDSEPIVQLSDFLKKNKEHGFSLVELDGRPTLHFEPGLELEQKERWDLAIKAINMIEAALPDLEYLMSQGLINLKTRGSF